MLRDSELKAIPEGFQKGLEEGEIESRSRKANSMKEVDGNEQRGGRVLTRPGVLR